MAILSATRPLHRILLDFHACTVFQPDFRGSFWRPYGAQNGSCGILSESSQCLLFNDIRFVRIRVRTEELWLPEVGVLELFFRVFPTKIPTKRGKLLANRELRLAVGVVFFLTHSGSQINSQRAGRNLRAKAVVQEEKHVRFSAHFPYFCLCSHARLT